MLPFTFFIPFSTALLQSTLSAAYSWRLNAEPTQCSNLSISIIGSDGQPPYHVLVIPSGPSPFAHDVQVRSVVDQAFDGNSTTVNFPINYPANSHFVAVVSDATGFGTGGTSVEMKVTDSNDTSCFDPTVPWSPSFHYSFGSNDEIVQCASTRVWWNASDTEGTPTFVGVIPGGQSFPLKGSTITVAPNQGTGFSWTPCIRGGTTLLVVGGDTRGLGAGKYTQFAILPSNDTTCINSLSPSSTPGTPAGSIATNTSGPGGPSSGTIIGGVVGGLVGVMSLITFSILSCYCLRWGGKNNQHLQNHAPLEPPVTMVTHQRSPISPAPWVGSPRNSYVQPPNRQRGSIHVTVPTAHSGMQFPKGQRVRMSQDSSHVHVSRGPSVRSPYVRQSGLPRTGPTDYVYATSPQDGMEYPTTDDLIVPQFPDENDYAESSWYRLPPETNNSPIEEAFGNVGDVTTLQLPTSHQPHFLPQTLPNDTPREDLGRAGSPREVGTARIAEAAHFRRKRDSTYKCNVPGCSATFTTRHDYAHHTNAHYP